MEKCGSQRTGKSIKRKTLVFGLLLLGLGTTWLLYNMGILPYEAWDAIISWQTLLIAIGLINIANGGSRGFGFILILVGFFPLKTATSSIISSSFPFEIRRFRNNFLLPKSKMIPPSISNEGQNAFVNESGIT